MPVILGIDPGSRITGYGVIQQQGSEHTCLTYGNIKVTASTLEGRLEQIFSGITDVIETYRPEEAAIEQVFMAHNANSALKLGQARGVAIVAIANHTIPVSEYSARQIKQSVVGYGAARKEQVQHMIRCLLNLKENPQMDAADALATALCHANTRQSLANLGGSYRIRRGRLR